MNKLMQGVERFWKDEEGGETVEWALVVAVIVAAFVLAYVPLEAGINTAFGNIITALTT